MRRFRKPWKTLIKVIWRITMKINSSVQLQSLDGLVEVRPGDLDSPEIKVFWSMSSHFLIAIDTESMCVIRYGPCCLSEQQAIEKAKGM